MFKIIQKSAAMGNQGVIICEIANARLFNDKKKMSFIKILKSKCPNNRALRNSANDIGPITTCKTNFHPLFTVT